METATPSQTPAPTPAAAPTAAPAKPKGSIFPIILIILLLAIAAGAYFAWPQLKTTFNNLIGKTNDSNSEKETPEETYKSSADLGPKFATYSEVPVTATPAVKAVTINPNLSNIYNLNAFKYELDAQHKTKIATNGFVVGTPRYDEFYPLYESNRYTYVANFVTTDSMLHNYHLMFNYLLEKTETAQLAPELKKLNSAMLTDALAQYETLKGTEWETAAKRSVAFFTIGSKLMDSTVVTPAIVKTEVDAEMVLINAHTQLTASPIMNMGNTNPSTMLKEDYTQYVPRGHYSKSALLKAYFKSMMWYGRLTFRLKMEDEIKSSVLITLALTKPANQTSWDKIYEPINFFVGKSDDITYYQYKDLLEHSFGANPTLASVTSDKTKLASFVNLAKKLEPPQINSMPVFQASIDADREEEIKGFRFMGQRFTIDASVFQRLVYREVGDKTKTCAQFDPQQTDCQKGARCLPKGLDVVAAMGSDEALNILTEAGETKYACYTENLNKMKTYIGGLKTTTWTQNLYWGWLYALKPLTTVKGAGYPGFMQNVAWQRKDINTYLGSWTELKHDTILYAKQVYAELGAGSDDLPKWDDRGYVEPNAEVYARLAALLKMTSSGLDSRGLISAAMKTELGKMETLALSLKTISEKELNNQPRTAAEYELIRSYGGQIEHFWLEANKEDIAKSGLDRYDYLEQNPAALVADVATDPNGQALEEGTGKIAPIYVVFELEGKLRIAKGGVYSYYEFPQPMSNRLTDQAWRQKLNSASAPKMPTWTNIYK